jgi:hypothetical protein
MTMHGRPLLPRSIVAPLLAMALAACAAPAEAQFETPNRQFHDATTFPLDGRHRDLPCESCHRGDSYKGTPTRCFDCHWVRRQDDRFRLQLGSQCEQCHRTTSWSAVRWDHESMTSMPLGPAHRQLPCQSCHTGNSFRAAQPACVACHQQDYEAARNPNHVAAGFPTACEACHRPGDATFNQARFDHAAVFPLLGPHRDQTCAACHTNNVYAGLRRDCVGCHRADYDRTTTPNHAAAGFPTTCEDCHRAADSAFDNGRFDHNAAFALVGRHAQAACTACHRGLYRGTPRECVGCHRDAYDRTTRPSHAAAGFPVTCESCHRPTDPSFEGAALNHGVFFPLAGRHAQASCAACHENNVYRGTPRDCVGCHRSDYDHTSSPSHAAAGFSTSCSDCHRNSDSSWTQGRFDHRFPLRGPHRTACSSCHQSSQSYATFTCLTCHERGETDDEHRERAGYRYESLACYGCHPDGRH